MNRSRAMIAIFAVCVVLVAYSTAGTVVMQVVHGVRTPIEFTGTPTSGVAPLAVQFTGPSIGSPAAWLWDFGDGTTATVQNAAHIYSAAGSYTVRLVVSTAAGEAQMTRVGYITVHAGPPSGWTTIVDDEFDTPGVPSHWSVYSGPYNDGAHNCAAPSQVQAPGDGYLHLKMAYLTSGVCGAGWYTGGMQIRAAYGGVDQAITVRWRIVPAADPSIVHSVHIVPMRWVDDPNYAWYQGESNYCEGAHLGGCYTYLHYGRSSQVIHGYVVDLTQWHTWRVEQRHHQVIVFIDNMTNPVWVYTGNETTIPSAIRRAVLQQECPRAACPSAAYAGEVEDIQIDWITIENPAA